MASTYDVFISYSSADRPLAESVHSALEGAELTVWRDRERLVPGLRFTKSIFDALRASRLCLCLVSRSYLDSGYAAQETGAAHGFGVRLFPVRVGTVGYEQLVGVLREQHVPSLGDDLPDVAALVREVSSEIVGVLRGVRGSAVPPVPPYYVERAELRTLLPALTRAPVPWFGLVGRPGSGRTTLAAALAAAIAPSVDERVFWVQREEASPESGLVVHLQARLLAQLTDTPTTFNNWQDGRRVLRRHASALPRTARCMLFLDDADAEPEILPAFDINQNWTVVACGQDPAVLMSQIRADHMLTVGGMSTSEAALLAATITECDPALLPSEARELIERLDRLPAVIAMASMLVRSSVDPRAAWGDLLQTVVDGSLEELERPGSSWRSALAVLNAAFDPITKEQLAALRALAALPDGTNCDISLLQRLWKSTQERSVRALASRLHELALLEKSSSGMRLPSLVRSFLRHKKGFQRTYINALGILYPELAPLIIAILWNDADVFPKLLGSRAQSQSTTASRGRRRANALKSPADVQHEGFRALHFAIQHHRTNMVASLLQAGAIVNVAAEPSGQTALHFAAFNSDAEMAELLLAKGADPNAPEREGYTALHVAAQGNSVELAAMLLRCGANPRARNANGNHPLYVAATFGATDLAALLIDRDPELARLHGENGDLPLAAAARAGHASVVDVLLAAGVGADQSSSFGEPPLFLASLNGHLEVVSRLIEAGASLDAAVAGVTALYVAAQEGHTSVVRRLLEAGADPSGGRLDNQHTIATHAAAARGYEDIVRLLVEAGAPIDVGDVSGLTPLHYSVQASEIKVAYSARMTMDEQGIRFAAAQVLGQYYSAALVEYLLLAGAPVNQRSVTGDTALHLAATQNRTDVALALARAGADTTLRNAQGLTPADEARRWGHAAVAELLDRGTSSGAGAEVG